jgi:hypothetical protein
MLTCGSSRFQGQSRRSRRRSLAAAVRPPKRGMHQRRGRVASGRFRIAHHVEIVKSSRLEKNLFVSSTESTETVFLSFFLCVLCVSVVKESLGIATLPISAQPLTMRGVKRTAHVSRAFPFFPYRDNALSICSKTAAAVRPLTGASGGRVRPGSFTRQAARIA